MTDALKPTPWNEPAEFIDDFVEFRAFFLVGISQYKLGVTVVILTSVLRDKADLLHTYADMNLKLSFPIKQEAWVMSVKQNFVSSFFLLLMSSAIIRLLHS